MNLITDIKVFDLIQLGIYVLMLASFYWLIRIQVEKNKIEIDMLKTEVEEIKTDRRIKWDCYQVEQKDQFKIFAEIRKSLGEFNGDLKQIATDITWLKKNN